MEQLPKIVQQRLQASGRAGEHPDPDLLTAFAEKALHERERAQVLQHLSQCADCREVVSLAMPGPEVVVPSAIPQRSHWLTWPVLRWGALAACAVVVTAAVTLRYERRLGVAKFESQPAAVPAQVANNVVDNRASDEPAQKLAAKISPPSPFPSDRTFDSAGKLAKQRDDVQTKDAQTKSVAGAAVAGIENGRLQNQPLEDGALAAGQAGNSGLANNQRAESDAFRSLDRDRDKDKPSALLTGQVAAPVPSAPALAESKTASTEEHAKERNENFDYAAKPARETVTAGAEAPMSQTAQANVGGAKGESDKKAKNAEKAEFSSALRRAHPQSAMNKTALRWTLSPQGALQRSFDSGNTWQTIEVAKNVTFRALASNDFDLWVGGASGVLYHSSDAGQHWTQVKPSAEGNSLTADIVGVEFSDIQHGTLRTGSRETWTTTDGGVTWHRN